MEGVLIQGLDVVVVEQIEAVVLVKVQAQSCMGMGMGVGGGKDWSSRLRQIEVCHFAHNPTSRHARSLALTGACTSLCAADG